MPDTGAGHKIGDSIVTPLSGGRFPYYRRFHSDALRGMSKLSLEERGAYDLILDLTYEKGGPIDDDDAHLARQANCSTRKWRAVKHALVAHGKLIVHEGKLWNGRAMLELERSQRLHIEKAEAGRKGAKIRAERCSNSSTKTPRNSAEFEGECNENKAPDQAELEIAPQLPESISRESSSGGAPSFDAPPPSPLIGGGGALEAQRQDDGKPSDKRSATRARFDTGAFAQRATTITEAEDEEGATP
jgi:uncharacterized protein YdaU (DUF1376 family)